MRDTEAPDVLGLFQPPKPLGDLAAESLALLARAKVQLALAEAGTEGEIARLIKAADERGIVLTKARAFGQAEELAAALRVSPAKVDAFGAISAMVAAEAAAELIDTYEGGWGIVVMAPSGNRARGPGVESMGGVPADAFIALGTPSTTVIQQCPPDQVIQTTLELLKQQALRRMRTPQWQKSPSN